MLDEFKHEVDIAQLPDDPEFETTNYIIAMSVFLIETIKATGADDVGFERYEFETLLSEKTKGLDKAFSSLLDILYAHHFTVSVMTIDEYILQLKLSAIFERITNELDT